MKTFSTFQKHKKTILIIFNTKYYKFICKMYSRYKKNAKNMFRIVRLDPQNYNLLYWCGPVLINRQINCWKIKIF